MEDKRNLILAVVLAALILFGWPLVADRFFPGANPPATKIQDGKEVALPNPGADPAADTATAIRSRAIVLKESPRIAIDSPKMKGSINLKGARVDDVILPTYRETVAKDSPPVRLFSPAGTPDSYFAGFGWSGNNVRLPAPDTVWTASAPALTPTSPVTLRWDNGQGQVFQIDLALDQNYMITAEQKVANRASAPVTVTPYSYISRTGISKDKSSWTIHTGPIGVFNGAADYSVDFKDLDETGIKGQDFQSTGGWIGFTDKYWLSALIPDQQAGMNAAFRAGGNEKYQADMHVKPVTVAPGKVSGTRTRLFVGAKETNVLRDYQRAGISQFDRAIDWGWFYWFEQPIFFVLDWLFRHLDNFGLAIICLTVIVRGLMFPIAQRQFRSMAQMRALQPKMKAIQERHKDDKAKQQQAVMELYRTEKVNPLGGCLPMFLQIPIFFALYKVLELTIEMRHQPFILWIRDLSAPDPLHILNLFGLLDFQPPGFLAIGLLALLLGFTMWLQFRMNPTATADPMQQQIMQFMPWMLMFVMAPSPAGLLIYWCTSNILTLAQQQYLYSRHPGLKQAPAK